MMKFFLKKVKILNKRANLFWHWQTGCHSLKITSKFFCQPREVSRKFMTYIIFNTKLKKNLSHHQGRTSTFPPLPPILSAVSPIHKRGGRGDETKRAALLLFMQIDGWKVFQLHLTTVLPFQFLVSSSPLLTFSFTWLHHLLHLTDGGFNSQYPWFIHLFYKANYYYHFYANSIKNIEISNSFLLRLLEFQNVHTPW